MKRSDIPVTCPSMTMLLSTAWRPEEKVEVHIVGLAGVEVLLAAKVS